MTKILVTGAGGYIGGSIIPKLIDCGYEVIAVTRGDIARIDSRARRYCLDVLSEDFHSNVLEFGYPDLCLHLAWSSNFTHNSPAHLAELYAHYAFLAKLIEGGLKHLAVLGSMHEIGYWEGMIDESTPTNPLTLYGIAKNTLRHSLQTLLSKHEFTLQWLRAFYITGSDDKNESIFSKILQWEQEGRLTFPFTSGKNKYDFIDVAELSNMIIKVLAQKNVNGIINCCSGNPIALKDKVGEFITQNKLSIKPDFNVFKDRPYDSPAIWGCNKKINDIVFNEHNLTYEPVS